MIHVHHVARIENQICAMYFVFALAYNPPFHKLDVRRKGTIDGRKIFGSTFCEANDDYIGVIT